MEAENTNTLKISKSIWIITDIFLNNQALWNIYSSVKIYQIYVSKHYFKDLKRIRVNFCKRVFDS